MNEPSQLRSELIKAVTPSRLKDISISLIAHFKNKDIRSLTFYAQRAGIDAPQAGLSRTFAALIRIYHPDRFAAIIQNIETLTEADDADALRKLSALYIFTDPRPQISRNVEAEKADDTEEEYRYEEGDFGWREQAEQEQTQYTDETEGYDAGEQYEHTFTEAVNRHFYGNLDEAVTLSDLKNLDGELDLSEYSITDLSGIEHCINLTALNLSGNHIRSISRIRHLEHLESLYLSGNIIESISALADLAYLKELDLSFNQIEDITAMLTMSSLEYVNLAGNPAADPRIIESLKKRGVIIIT